MHNLCKKVALTKNSLKFAPILLLTIIYYQAISAAIHALSLKKTFIRLFSFSKTSFCIFMLPNQVIKSAHLIAHLSHKIRTLRVMFLCSTILLYCILTLFNASAWFQKWSVVPFTLNALTFSGNNFKQQQSKPFTPNILSFKIPNLIRSYLCTIFCNLARW